MEGAMSEERWGLPIPPEKTDDDFTKMALLFIDTHDELIAAAKAMEHIDIDDNRKERYNALQMRYLSIILRRNERLLAEDNDSNVECADCGMPVPECICADDTKAEQEMSPEAEIIAQSADPAVR